MSSQHTPAALGASARVLVVLALLLLSACGQQTSPVAPSSNASPPGQSANASVTISGYVYQELSSAGEPPIADAVITLRDAQGAESTAISDRRGYYQISATPGEVVVTATKDGYNTRESRFDVTDSTVLNFGLAPMLP
jgi:hypothetical protein